MTRKATGLPEKRVITSYTSAHWELRCFDCEEVLVIDWKPVDTTLWVHALQAHPCNDFYYSMQERERHAQNCPLEH